MDLETEKYYRTYIKSIDRNHIIVNTRVSEEIVGDNLLDILMAELPYILSRRVALLYLFPPPPGSGRVENEKRKKG